MSDKLHFESATKQFDDTTEYFNPIVVSSKSEFGNLMEDISFVQPLKVKSLHLPPGIDITDPRIRHAKTVSARCYYREDNKFDFPDLCHFADIDANLNCIADVPVPGKTTRIQVIPASQIPIAEELAHIIEYNQDNAIDPEYFRSPIKEVSRAVKNCCNC